jgi:aminopeptidase N
MTDVIYPAGQASCPGRARRIAASAARSSLALLGGLMLAAPAGAALPFSFASAPGRLPKSVVPVDYTIAITPDAVARTLRGHESIVLDFRGASAQLVFNSLNETLSDVRLDGQPAADVNSNDEQQLTTVKLVAPVPAGRHTLSFDYAGKIETIPQGLFAQAYVVPGGGKGLLLSTQFESTDARRMFPCWDEPAFRATFELTVTVPSEWTAVSNMPIAHREAQGGLASIRFERSPSMPSYLVHLTAGDLASVSARSGPTRLGVWAVRGQEKYGAVALANAAQILADYNDYFDYPYPLAKLDSIAVPGGFTGAMEDWGAISYNDQALLVTPSSTVDDIQNVYSYQAHEMAHQWHGDLVTMAWWDDVWLNESFASWRGAAQADARHPDWHWWEGQDEVKEQAMRADARVSSHAIEQPVTNELEATNVFDPDITYNKGQAVLRMLEAHLGADHFRDGVRRLMKAHAYSNASSEDLWAALGAASGRNVSVIARSWTEQPGFPVVSVTARCDAQGLRTLALSQRRFLLRGEDSAGTRWMIPLEIRSGTSGDSLPELLVRDGQTVAAGNCDEPLTVNANAVGYFRAEYDETTLATTTRAFATLPAGDRIALLDDQWALVEAGAAPLPTYLKLASAMGTDLNERAWNQVVGALGTIEYAERGSAGHAAFIDYARSLVRPVFGKLGWDGKPGEPPGTQRLRRTVIGSLGLWGDKEIIAEARHRFALFLKDRAALKPDEQAVVLTIVARYADAASFKQLHAVAKSAANETELRRYYTALMSVRDPALAAAAATIALSGEIPPQADSLRLWLVLALSGEHQQLAWDAFVKHLDALLAPHQPYGPLYIAQYGPGMFWSSVPLDQLEAWVKANVPAEMTADIARGMETARFKIAEKSALVAATDHYLATRAQAVSGELMAGALRR